MQRGREGGRSDGGGPLSSNLCRLRWYLEDNRWKLLSGLLTGRLLKAWRSRLGIEEEEEAANGPFPRCLRSRSLALWVADNFAFFTHHGGLAFSQLHVDFRRRTDLPLDLALVNLKGLVSAEFRHYPGDCECHRRMVPFWTPLAGACAEGQMGGHRSSCVLLELKEAEEKRMLVLLNRGPLSHPSRDIPLPRLAMQWTEMLLHLTGVPAGFLEAAEKRRRPWREPVFHCHLPLNCGRSLYGPPQELLQDEDRRLREERDLLRHLDFTAAAPDERDNE